MSLTNTSSSITEPLTVAELQDHSRIDGDDAYLTRLISASRKAAEAETKRVIPLQEFTWVTNEFAQGMALPVYPFASIVSISYVDVDGVTQTIAGSEYQVVTEGQASMLYHRGDWPALESGTYNRVTIVMNAGTATFDEDLKQAMIMIASGLYENREDEIVGTIVSKISLGSKLLLAPYKRHSL